MSIMRAAGRALKNVGIGYLQGTTDIMAQKAAQKREDEKGGIPVFLQPYPYGPDNSRVRYAAFYRTTDGQFKPVKNDGIDVVFDLAELLQTVSPDFDPEE